ncbi:MAG: hypothetical protein JO040_01100 [Gemmatimonadetes bacterium]|nr:hypothetical protein [Gemmatimonadota bacterium]
MLSEAYPRLYHMAEADSWDSIQRYGLLSTTALLDRFEYAGAERERIESQRRSKNVVIEHPEYGRAVIRDNIPMRERALEQCLQGYTPREWYELLNRRVFFWLSRERLFRLLRAREYRRKRQTILTVNTERLLQRHAARVSLSAINSGATLYTPQPRGVDTFRSIEDYPIGYWRRKRSWKDAVVELTVDYNIPDIRDLTLRVEHVEGGETVEVLWER